MSEHAAHVVWSSSDRPFTYDTFDRGHTVTLGSGQTLAVSSAKEFLGDATRTNPEELLVGALASCHMLTFLAVAARKRLTVVRYEDDAVGTLAKNAEGRLAITHVTLRPRVELAPGTPLDATALRSLHDLAHKNCFVANSVHAEVTIEPR